MTASLASIALRRPLDGSHRAMFIGGQWVDALSSKTFETRNPATGEVLAEGGHFLAKTFQGGTERDLLNMLKQNFKQVIHVKPGASRAESVEMFLLAKGFKGRKARDEAAEVEEDA